LKKVKGRENGEDKTQEWSTPIKEERANEETPMRRRKGETAVSARINRAALSSSGGGRGSVQYG